MPQSNYSRYLIVIGCIAVLIIFFVGAGIYRFGWRGRFVAPISRLIPYPAAVVDWEPISYSTFLDELQTAERYWQAQSDKRRTTIPVPNAGEVRRRLLEKLIEQRLVQIWARKHNLSLTAEDLEQEWQKFLKTPDAKTEADLFFKEIYGWEDKKEEKFKTQVLSPWLAAEKVKLALAREVGRDEVGAKARAEEIYKKINKDGANFAELARAESDDKLSAPAGGSLGYVGQEQFEPAAAEAIFKLKIGQISKPLRSSEGYQIVKVEDLLYNNYRQPVKASLRQIFVKFFDFDQWLEKQKQAIIIWRLVR